MDCGAASSRPICASIGTLVSQWSVATGNQALRSVSRRERSLDTERSGWAVGWTYFAGFMMIMLGTWHAIAGLSAILKKAIYSTGGQLGDGYFLKFNVSTWGWIHLILGIVIVLAGFWLFTGAVWARTIGVILAILSALAGFGWLPYYPVWGILIVAIAVAVIWALTVHGRDVASDTGFE